jgi:prepilin-type N-terminal cleavage/methylation domain-containing protein
MCCQNLKDNTGFSLLEIVVALAIIGIITGFAISISNSINNMGKTTETKNRMGIIVQEIKDYYKGHGSIPAPAVANRVPIDAGTLNMEQKTRLDSWGKYLYYYTGISISSVIVNNGNKLAGYIISNGPDQIRDTDVTTDPNLVIIKGDDILIPVNVSNEAIQITLGELMVLQDKINAYDALFEGIDNDGDGAPDEDGCIKDLGNAAACPPSGDNDPNCGTATLDNLPGYTCTYSTADAISLITELYSLSTQYKTDPWGNAYVWGDASLTTTNPRYHKFFSKGSDGVTGTSDDIIP